MEAMEQLLIAGKKHHHLSCVAVFGNRCFYCKSLLLGMDHNGHGIFANGWPLTNDHVWPRSLGGVNCSVNIVPCCYKCNQEKGNKVDWPFVLEPHPVIDLEKLRSHLVQIAKAQGMTYRGAKALAYGGRHPLLCNDFGSCSTAKSLVDRFLGAIGVQTYIDFDDFITGFSGVQPDEFFVAALPTASSKQLIYKGKSLG